MPFLGVYELRVRLSVGALETARRQCVEVGGGAGVPAREFGRHKFGASGRIGRGAEAPQGTPTLDVVLILPRDDRGDRHSRCFGQISGGLWVRKAVATHQFDFALLSPLNPRWP